jgi:predicted RNase H-like HicB family nuclease
MKKHLTAIVSAEGDGYVALCPELDIASQGATIPEARAALLEAVELFYECASPQEVDHRLQGEIYVSPMEVTVG